MMTRDDNAKTRNMKRSNPVSLGWQTGQRTGFSLERRRVSNLGCTLKHLASAVICSDDLTEVQLGTVNEVARTGLWDHRMKGVKMFLNTLCIAMVYTSLLMAPHDGIVWQTQTVVFNKFGRPGWKLKLRETVSQRSSGSVFIKFDTDTEPWHIGGPGDYPYLVVLPNKNIQQWERDRKSVV